MRLQAIQSQVEKHSELISNFIAGEKLLSALDTSAIGIVICDRQFRYKALNGSAAKMHNVPVEAHMGHTFHQILGNMAEKVVPLWENVFVSGRRLSNLEITGKLPKRVGVGRWIENLFPLADRRGRVAQVGCFVIEISQAQIPSSSLPSPTGMAALATTRQPSSKEGSQSRLLSRREREIVQLVAEGKSNKEISSLLAISVRTVETYRSRLMLKLQAPSIAHLVHYAIKNHIIAI